MPVQEKVSFPRQYSVRSSECSETPQLPETTPESETVKSEIEQMEEPLSETPDDSNLSVDEPEESDEDESIKADPLIPYSIALLHQVLAFLISITNPSK